ncbi:MAG: hypothetical protein HYW57_03110, partial [Ignavibacteriales bacterium]|nr:hypothetical protein [Ignavibacteriales bacterium]
RIQVPPQLRGIYAERQHGGFLQANVPAVRGLFDRWPRSKLTASLRYEFVDFDRDLKGDDHQRLTLGINVRFIQDAVLKFNYEQNWMTDRENNLTRSVRLLMSFASYF